MLARVAHPQTNGKLERVYGEIRRKMPLFFDVAGPPGSACPINPPTIETDPLTRFMKWYNYDRPHMFLDTDIEETPAMAFEHKMPPAGSDAADEQGARAGRMSAGMGDPAHHTPSQTIVIT